MYIGQITVLEVTVEVNFKCSKLWQEYFCAQYGRWAVFGILVWKANNSLVLNKLLFQLYQIETLCDKQMLLSVTDESGG